mmetsp:Transcript_25792/g.55128  ORF Transcript_25792/g.55128 Transcript_25792/m.55128 type:complete len:203 (-) Transcript_25792:2242-2850(-)
MPPRKIATAPMQYHHLKGATKPSPLSYTAQPKNDKMISPGKSNPPFSINATTGTMPVTSSIECSADRMPSGGRIELIKQETVLSFFLSASPKTEPCARRLLKLGNNPTNKSWEINCNLREFGRRNTLFSTGALVDDTISMSVPFTGNSSSSSDPLVVGDDWRKSWSKPCSSKHCCVCVKFADSMTVPNSSAQGGFDRTPSKR